LGAVLIITAIVLSNSVGILLWRLEYGLHQAAIEALHFAVESHTTQIRAKDAEIDQLKTELKLAELRAPKISSDTVRAKNWRQVLSINEHQRAEQERKEQEKYDNTAIR